MVEALAVFTAKALKGLTKPGRNGLGAEREATAPPPCGSAHHPVTDTSADHREPGAMAFCVVPEAVLPQYQRISLAAPRTLTTVVGIAGLGAQIAT